MYRDLAWILMNVIDQVIISVDAAALTQYSSPYPSILTIQRSMGIRRHISKRGLVRNM